MLPPSVSKHSVICYFVTTGKKLVKIYPKLRKGYGDNMMSRVMVWMWSNSSKKVAQMCTMNFAVETLL